mmetsp:Transcript_10973/g.27364  ORF Transcript_10973/g.27364 Transcript_10973/m.27364 type:complete len:94 (-) Transcript_10973:691-972(-)
MLAEETRPPATATRREGQVKRAPHGLNQIARLAVFSQLAVYAVVKYRTIESLSQAADLGDLAPQAVDSNGKLLCSDIALRALTGSATVGSQGY